MNDRRLLQARLAVRRAATRLTKDAPALAMAPANVREVGLAARMADLCQAVLAARRAGVCLQDITQDAGLEMATIEEWIAANSLRHTSW
jgi:hypothetical protein